MNVETLIEAYVQDVARRLPRKQRADVATELRELLREELHARASAEGGVLDATIALDGLRAFGDPRDVAVRYAEPWVIIAPADTRRFAFAALIGALVLLALSPLSNDPAPGKDALVAMFAWLGLLTGLFGLHSLVRRLRAKPAARWQPRDRERINRFGAVALIALIGVGMLAYAAPAWLFGQFTHSIALPAPLRFDPQFHAWRLPVLFALWLGQAAMFAVLAVRGRWTPLLRKVDLALEIGVVLALVWFLADSRIMLEVVSNRVALHLLAVVVALMSIDIGIKLYRGLDPFPSAQGRHVHADLRGDRR